MKRFRTMFFFATVLLGLAAVAPAQDEGACSTATAVGTWGWTETGTQFQPNGAVVFSAIGVTTHDADGNVSGWTTRSTGGTMSHYTIKGTGTVNPDCTGTATVNLYDDSGNLFSTAILDHVYVDNGRERYSIITSSVRPDGTKVPVAIIMYAKKMFPTYTMRFSLDRAPAIR